MIEAMIGSVVKEVAVKALFEYYKPDEVNGYCEACPNYDRIWSCPPYMKDEVSHLRAYDKVLLIGVKTKNFGVAKKSLGKALIQLSEKHGLDVLIAGNCFLCKPCAKQSDEPCAHPEQMKHSLESLGFHVSDICTHLLDAPLEWNMEDPTYLATAAVFLNAREKLTDEIIHELGLD